MPQTCHALGLGVQITAVSRSLSDFMHLPLFHARSHGPLAATDPSRCRGPSLHELHHLLGLGCLFTYMSPDSKENKCSWSWRQLEKGLMAVQELPATWRVTGTTRNSSSLSSFTRNSKYASDVKSQQSQLPMQKWHSVSEFPYWEQGPRKKSWFWCVSHGIFLFEF